jgi:hypothetical protein
MATVTVTWTAGQTAGSGIRGLANALLKLAADVPDTNATGASTVLTIDNSTSSGEKCSVQITAGPYAGSKVLVGG